MDVLDHETQQTLLLQAMLLEVETVILYKYEQISHSQYINLRNIVENKQVKPSHLDEFDELLNTILNYRTMLSPIAHLYEFDDYEETDILLDLVSEGIITPNSVGIIKSNDILNRLIPLWYALLNILKG